MPGCERGGFLIRSLQNPAKLVSEREIEVSTSQRLVVNMICFYFYFLMSFSFPFSFFFLPSFFPSFRFLPSFLSFFLLLPSFFSVEMSPKVLFLIPLKCLLHHGRIQNSSWRKSEWNLLAHRHEGSHAPQPPVASILRSANSDSFIPGWAFCEGYVSWIGETTRPNLGSILWCC